MKIIIDNKLTEQFVVENSLNMLYSGVNKNVILATLGIYFLGTQSKNALYYFNLIENCIDELEAKGE